MAYTKQTWADGDNTKPLSAARMNAIETGIENAHILAETKDFAIVVHGSNASAARPAAYHVLWVGTVQPNNWVNGDNWDQV